MRTVVLLRHAKSAWPVTPAGAPPLGDHDRPLAPRGQRDAPRMAQWMAAQRVRPDLILCSSAVRTRQTLELVTDAITTPTTKLVFRDDLYHADEEHLIAAIRAIDDQIGQVMFVGHDPGLHDTSMALAGHGDRPLLRLLSQKFPTAAVAVIEFEAERWRQIASGGGTLRQFMAPKRLPA